MRNIFLIVANTLKRTFRKKGNIIVYIVMPIVTVMISIGMYSNTGTSKLRLGIVNKDSSNLSKEMTDYINKSDRFNVSFVEESEINSKVSKSQLDCVLVIPKGFENDIMSSSFKNVELISVKGEDTTVWIENFTNFYIKNLTDIAKASNGNKETFNRIYEGFKNQKLKLEPVKVQDEQRYKGITSQSMGFLIMFMMLGASMTSNIILKEKRDRTYFRVCSAPVNSRTYLSGNVIANLLVIILQIALVIIMINKVLKIKTFVPDAQLFVILLCFGLVSIGLGMMIVSFSRSTAQAGNLMTLIVTPTCMLGGCFWDISFMPDTLQKVSNFMPQKWTIEAITKIQHGGSFNDITANLAIVLSFALALFLIAAYKMSRNDDVRNFI